MTSFLHTKAYFLYSKDLPSLDELQKWAVEKLSDVVNKDFSRVKVPYGSKSFYCHKGIYAFKRHTLEKIKYFKSGKLGDLEDLEQLKWLENSMKIKMLVSKFSRLFQINQPSIDQHSLSYLKKHFSKEINNLKKMNIDVSKWREY